MNREQQLAEALVGLAGSFADDVDPVVLLDRLATNCREITGADEVGVMVAPLRGGLRIMAVTDDRAALLELFQLQTEVAARTAGRRWPRSPGQRDSGLGTHCRCVSITRPSVP
ncbi:hypothetical protein A6P39_005160 [Streptomyces sp. FXJ1.172]|uniref:hypothetical protein n=1 Tax=Streptomyces sp. FXJ1.172 TaxID=710705 RepID=UPI0007D0272D|nr:hypothetical protein [Streptomyces sp. FXJ1.172]WEO93456.1 hypothetical protein A6P39_005160 [Streptomyces sp. FXJ1.172]